jgi:hypothetical protein
MNDILPPNFPVLATQSKRQMKDLEMVGNLLLLFEEGPRSYPQDQLDAAYSNRDENWAEREIVTKEFTTAIIIISEIMSADLSGTLVRSRLKNQTDFYSLAGAIHKLQRAGPLPPAKAMAERLQAFIGFVDDPDRRAMFSPAESYYAASRSASNDQGPRQTRINMISGVISGDLSVPGFNP